MKNIKLLSLLLACATIFTALPVSAYELDSNGDSIESVTYQNSEDEDFSNETSVLAELGSTYKVTIPKFIVLSGKNKSANYKVSVEGDIAGTEDVIVTPDETVSLYSKNKDAQIASISQDKTSWHYDTFDVDANGSITADGITAGKWSGTFNFNINLINSINEVKVLSDIILPPLEEDATLPNLALKSGFAETVKFDEQDLDKLLGMSSSDENIVAVEDTKIIAKNPGTATITTEFIDKDLTFDVTVTENKNQLIHTHTAATVVTENEIPATCIKKGSYDEVIYCKDCGEVLSKIRKNTNLAEHNYVNGICSVCGVELAPGLYYVNNNLSKSWDELTALGLDVETDYNNTDYFYNQASVYSVFTNNNLSGNLILPNTVTKIGNYAFYCFVFSTPLRSIKIPDSVTSIGKYAFCNCTDLKSVTISDGVTSIDTYAFSNCTSLESITIPDSVTSIGAGAFYNVKHIYYNGQASGAPWGALAMN